MTVFAEDTGTAASSGECGADGSNVKWEYDGNGTLTISGSGAMKNYSYSDDAPWYESLRSSIKTVVMKEGVTSVGAYAFYSHSALEQVTLPESLTEIGDSAFSSCRMLKSISVPAGVEKIGSSAFRSCTGLTSVTMHDDVTLHGQCFQYCKNLEEVIGSVHMTQGHDFVGCEKLRSLSIGEGHVSELIFQNMDALENLTFSEKCSFAKLQIIGCPSLTDLTIDGMAYSLHESDVTMEITGCDALRTLTIQPDAVVSSEPYRAYVGTVASVSDCAALEEIICRYPGDIQLKDCPSLKTLHRYSGTRHTTISGCDALETVYGLPFDIQLQKQCADLGVDLPRNRD